MSDISIYDDTIYNLLEELYRMNQRNWKKQILQKLVECRKASYVQIKEGLVDVPDLLAYRCLTELIHGQVIKRTKREQKVRYSLNTSIKYIKELINEL